MRNALTEQNELISRMEQDLKKKNDLIYIQTDNIAQLHSQLDY